MSNEPFSVRHGFRAEFVDHDDVPKWVRAEFVSMLKEFTRKRSINLVLDQSLFQSLRPHLRQFGMGPSDSSPDPWQVWIPAAFNDSPWEGFYDVCETTYKFVVRTFPKYVPESNPLLVSSSMKLYEPNTPEIFEEEVNRLFSQAHLVWQLQGGLIERKHDPRTEESLKTAFVVLSDPRFQGPNEQFERAKQQLDARPRPLTRECVLNAVGAVEAVANIVSGTNGTELSKLINQDPIKSGIHGALKTTLRAIYGYRGDTSAHGQEGPQEVGYEEAEWVMGMCADTVVYLVKKFTEEQTV